MSEAVKRPVALMTFAVLAILGFIVTMLLSVRESGTAAAAQQPDPAIANEIRASLLKQPGVTDAEVTNSLACVDGCKRARHNYSAKVELSPQATPVQISAIVKHHDEVAPGLVGMDEVPIQLSLGAQKTLRVDAVHYGFGLTQAQAFLTATGASGRIDVTYGPQKIGDSPLLSIHGELPGLVCANADTALSQMIPALSAAALAGGIPFSSVRFDCGSAVLESGIAAGTTFRPGWTDVATSIDRLCREEECGSSSGAVGDIYVSFRNGATVVTARLNDGHQLANDDLNALQSVVGALAAAGAANPQLNLQNY